MRGSCSPMSISTIRLPPNVVSMITRPRGSATARPITDALAPIAWRCKAASASSVASCATTQTTLPSFARYSGSSPRISHMPRTSGRIGIDASSSSMPSPVASAISLTLASPPRVGSRMNLTSDQTASRSSISPFRGAQSLAIEAESARSPRAFRIAAPWSPSQPLTITASPCRIR